MLNFLLDDLVYKENYIFYFFIENRAYYGGPQIKDIFPTSQICPPNGQCLLILKTILQCIIYMTIIVKFVSLQAY